MKTRTIAALSIFVSMLSLAGLVTATMQPIAKPSMTAPIRIAANDAPAMDQSTWYFPAQYVNQATEIEELPAQF